MLQSAMFSSNYASTALVGRDFAPVDSRRTASAKVGFTGVIAWGRALFARDELRALSAHLRRDIGLGPLD